MKTTGYIKDFRNYPRLEGSGLETEVILIVG